jgi:hypothetical protein
MGRGAVRPRTVYRDGSTQQRRSSSYEQDGAGRGSAAAADRDGKGDAFAVIQKGPDSPLPHRPGASSRTSGRKEKPP